MNAILLELLKTARVEKNLTQRDVAKKLGVKDNTISNWEKGKTEPDIEIFVRLCEIYDVNFAELLETAYRPKKNESSLTSQEQKHIKKYRALDERGKQTVDIVLDSQYELIQAKKETTCGLSDEEIEKELESYKQELLAEKKQKTLSVSVDIKGA